MKRILVLGGAHETEATMAGLETAGHSVRTYASRLPVGAARSDSLRAELAWAEGVVDVTHAFDVALGQMAHRMRPDLPSLRLARPLWHPEPGDKWHMVSDLAEGIATLPPAACVFAATGRDSVEMLAHHDGPVYVRQLQHHTRTAPPNCTFVFGSGPFDVEEEVSLFNDLNIEVVMARNTGGAPGFPKVAAARALDLPVILIAPQGRTDQMHVTRVAEVLDWVATL